MKKKFLLSLFLSLFFFAACGNNPGEIDTNKEISVLKSEVNKSLSKVNGSCKDVSIISAPDFQGKMVRVSLVSDNGKNFGKKCKEICDLLQYFEGGKYQDYSVEIMDSGKNESVMWNSDGDYVTSLDGKKYICQSFITLDELLEKDFQEDSDDPNSSISSDVSPASTDSLQNKKNEEYISLLKKYSEIFYDELKVIDTSEQLLQTISENKSTGEILSMLEDTIASVEQSKEALNNYFIEFDSNRQEPPYGTRIMTLLAHAQSAVTQYDIALSHLNEFLLSSNQNDIDDFQKYMKKTTQSLNDFDSVLNDELPKIK